jgi:ribosome-binding factor A
MRRVDEAIRQVIGDALAVGLKDPRVGFVTVTDVRTSADLRHARVYVSVLGDASRSPGAAIPGQPRPTGTHAAGPGRPHGRKGRVGRAAPAVAPAAAAEPAPSARARGATLEGLASARGFLQGRIASQLRLKRTPAFEFFYDDTTERALRVHALIDEVGRS